MQEKVREIPPTIKIFEGKPPPTSWVHENVIQYFQTQSQLNFLKDVLIYVQQLQSEKLLETRKQAAPLLKESFASLPEKGSVLDISNISTYNALQGHLKNELEFLGKLIEILKQGMPEQSQELERLLDQLNQTTKSFPLLSVQQLQNLNSLTEQLTNLANRAPNSTQRFFWNTQLRMLQTLMTNNQGNLKDFQNEMKEIEARSKMLIELEGLLAKTQETLKANPPTGKQFLELIENLEQLANQYGQLNPEQQQALAGYFQQLNLFKAAKGAPLPEVVADIVIQSKISEFIKSKPQATTQEIVQKLRAFLKESNLQSSPLPFMKNMGDAIENVLNKPQFSQGTGYHGILFAAKKENKIEPNESFLNSLLSTFAPDQTSLKSIDQASTAVSSVTAIEKTDNQTKVQAYQIILQQLKSIQQNFGKAAAWGVGKSLGAGQPAYGATDADSGGSLPNQFAHAILDHYMPGQEAALRELAMFLYLNNMGAEFGNTLLNNMLGFGEAADNFDFSNFLHSTSRGNFSGSVSKAKQQLSNERTQCSGAINKVTNSINHINNQIANYENMIKSGQYTPKQCELLQGQIKQLTALKQNLKVLYNPKTKTGQLENLRILLSQLTVCPPNGTPPPSSSKEFSIIDNTGAKDWQSKLSLFESTVINGDPKAGADAGGLVNVQSLAQNFQQTYSNQSQNQQMMLQMQMTETQQEWTVVSTALQLLNQMYMTISQAIYK